MEQLQGKLLIAMPGMGDPRFKNALVFLCVYSQNGAMGLVVNRPHTQVSFAALLEQLGIDVAPHSRSIGVHKGGPVEPGRGFVLHRDDYMSAGASMAIAGGYNMTATQDIIEALAAGEGPRRAVLALGYSGWAAGQLDHEIARHDWLVCDAQSEIIFAEDDGSKWGRALALLGVNPLNLSAQGGRA